MKMEYMSLFFLGIELIYGSAAPEEPVCTSRFDYDFKLLESFMELRQSYKSLNDTVQELRDDLGRQQAALQDVSLQRSKVAFYVQLSKDLQGIGNNQTILFDMVTTNIGNGYSQIDGVFTAPLAGLYVFFWTITNKDRTFMNTELIKNGHVFGKAMSDAFHHDDYAVASNTAILEIEKGDKIWIRSGTWHSHKLGGDLYSTFSGWLLST